ncbi:hypothetical protein C4D60_Mb11t08840 [Musa balbisiana]|uniref:Uncharacterized protein n=1 Tax=Musa balbisiana TaxID=52838 RepID=A0A4S8J490_MUSBA|nr:hypothetical protein C4D60_Mb11t08840 [Musa balbisiana]
MLRSHKCPKLPTAAVFPLTVVSLSTAADFRGHFPANRSLEYRCRFSRSFFEEGRCSGSAAAGWEAAVTAKEEDAAAVIKRGRLSEEDTAIRRSSLLRRKTPPLRRRRCVEQSGSESCCGRGRKMQQLRLLLAGKRGRHRHSPFAAIEEEDTTVEEAVRECFPPCVAVTESVYCTQQIGERARLAKKSKAGDEGREGVDEQSQDGAR